MDNSRLLKPEECCLHVVDPQVSLMKEIHEQSRVTRVIQLMIDCARVLQIPTVASTQYMKGLGPYVEPLEETVKKYHIPRSDKVEFSAYRNRETQDMVEAAAGRVSTVILVGVETHICIYQTAASILERGMTPWIVADGVSSRSFENHKLGLKRMRQMGAIVGPAEMIIYELLGKAGTATFKEILPYIIAFGKESE